MSRTRVQQTQISGSLSSDILDNLAAGSELAAQSTLVGDLNALRSQLNKIIGVGNWYDALSGTQDLADVYGAMHVTGADAAFQGDVSAVGDMSAVDGTFSGDLSAVGGDFTVVAGGGGNAEAGHLGYAGYIDGGGSAIQLSDALGNLSAIFPVGTPVAIYNSSDWSLAPVYFTSNGVSYFAGGGTVVTWLTIPVPAPFWGSDSVLVKVSDPAPAGASVLIQSSGGASSLSMDGNGSFTGDLSAVDATLSGDLSAVGGTFSGNIAAVDATLSGDLAAVDATLSGDLAAVSGSFSGNVSIAGDVAQRLYIVDADGTIKDESKLTFDGSALAVDGDIKIVDDAMNSGRLYMVGPNGEIASESKLAFVGQMTGWELNVDGSIVSNGQISAASGSFSGNLDAVDGTFSGNIAAVDATLSGDLSAVDGTFSGDLSAVDATLSGDLSAVGGTFSGNISAVDATLSGDLAAVDGAFSGDVSASSLSISGDAAQRLYIVDGDGTIKDEAKMTFDGSELAIDGDLAATNAHFTGNVQVDGDLRVKGSMTYIDTQNMRVEDAFIYLATGSAGTTDSGIVLARGAGANMDLVIGQDGGAGEVIFGKADRSPDGGGASDHMNGIELIPAWMSEIKLGGVEGSLSGSFSIEGNNMKLEAANDLSLAANGESVGLMSAADYTLFDTNFSATSIVGALNELYAAGAGGSKKGDLSVANVASNVLTFSSVGTLNSANHQFIDVYLNGVLLSSTVDLSSLSATSVELDSGIASGLTNDDVITVVLRGAA